jgi:hypothetical protein
LFKKFTCPVYNAIILNKKGIGKLYEKSLGSNISPYSKLSLFLRLAPMSKEKTQKCVP